MSGDRARPEPTTVTASQGEESGSVQIRDNYVLICDGTAYEAGMVVHHLKDGTQTHVITVKGCRP